MMRCHLLLARAIAAGLLLAAAASWSATGSADADAGARIASAGSANGAAACAGCHGARGEGAAAFPRLAGSGADYLSSQLEAFASGARKNPVMQPIAQALSAQQRAQVASYYASLPVSRASDREARGLADTGAWLATRGRWAEDLPACAQCHGPGGGGVGTRFPPLAGQSAAYIAAQLKNWQAGARPPGPLGLMEAVARKMKDADVEAVSEYYAGLTDKAAPAPAAATKGKP